MTDFYIITCKVDYGEIYLNKHIKVAMWFWLMSLFYIAFHYRKKKDC